MSGPGTSHPIAAPSGFFVLRTPLLPFTEVITWGHGLQAPMATDDSGVFDEAVATDRAQLRRRLEDIVTDAGVPGRLVRRIAEPGGSGRPVAKRPGLRQG